MLGLFGIFDLAWKYVLKLLPTHRLGVLRDSLTKAIELYEFIAQSGVIEDDPEFLQDVERQLMQ